jgi:hypothetical protein
MDVAPTLTSRTVEPIEVQAVIRIISEGSLAIVAALNHMLRDADEFVTALSGHCAHLFLFFARAVKSSRKTRL